MITKPDRKRLFFAIWPQEKIRAQLAQTRARHCPRGGRWTPAENLHVTLVFLGNIESQRIDSIEYAASRVEGKAFEMQLDRLQSVRAKGMVWLGPKIVPQELSNLVDALKNALSAQDYKIEKRAFRPHVTLIRKLAMPFERCEIDPVQWPVTSFALVESRQLQGASVYTPLKTWPLRA